MHQTITRGAAREAAPQAELATAQPVIDPHVTVQPVTDQPARAQVALSPATSAAAQRRGYAESAGSMASAAVLLGAAGLFVFNVVFGPLAIGVGTAALRRRTTTGWARAAALAGVALGAADLIVLAALVAVSLAHGGITWHFGA
ncbi:MAG TPA: hypothetical protein VE733_19110 [Streptosporangiaceae bacterium]|jgi:hypothetical protein|nr:hypothetical protein [Streptosporangiaceae bacterium]